MNPKDEDTKNAPFQDPNAQESTVFGASRDQVFGSLEEMRNDKKWYPVLIVLKGNQAKSRYVLKKNINLIGRDHKNDVSITGDLKVSRVHAAIIWENQDHRDESPRCFFEDRNSRNGSFLNHTEVKKRERLSDGDRIMLGETVFGFYIKDEHEVEYDNDLMAMATVDSLTGLINRRAFIEEARHSIASNQRYNQPLCLVLCDIDNFKEINDNHGHGTGDAVLRMVAKIILESLREADIVGRLGGDEFAILMPGTQLEEALSAVERMRYNLSEQSLSFENSLEQVTLSIGIAALKRDINKWNRLYKAADTALYDAKSKGRNCACISSFSQ